MKAKEIRAMSDEELKDAERRLREEIFNLRFRKATEQLSEISKVAATKRDLARVLTIMRERELGIGGAASEGTGGGEV